MPFLPGHFVGHEGEHFAKTLKHWLDWTGLNLDLINVFTIAGLRLEIEFMEGCSPTKSQLQGEDFVAVDSDQTTAD